MAARPDVATARPPAVLEVSDLSIAFADGHGTWRPATNGVSFTLHQGATLGLVGESGCGKSVTSLAVMGLLDRVGGRIDAGSVRLHGDELVGATSKALRHIRGERLAMIFQDATAALNPSFTVGSQIAETYRSNRGGTRRAARERALEVLDLVGIADPRRRYDAYPFEMSGGMCQRVMIAVALVCEPAVVIADEPTTALDVTVQAQILELLRELQDRLGMAMLFITHDLSVAAQVCDDVAVMRAGAIVEHRTVHDFFAGPSHPYSRSLLAAASWEPSSRAERRGDDDD